MPSVLNTASQSGVGFTQQVNAIRDVYSAEIWFAALPILKFDQFSTKKTELGVQPGVCQRIGEDDGRYVALSSGGGDIRLGSCMGRSGVGRCPGGGDTVHSSSGAGSGPI